MEDGGDRAKTGRDNRYEPPTTPPTIAPVFEDELLPVLLSVVVIWLPGAKTVVLAMTVVIVWPLLIIL
jgi:hypothetical protein